jgi:hypothetical protein
MFHRGGKQSDELQASDFLHHKQMARVELPARAYEENHPLNCHSPLRGCS